MKKNLQNPISIIGRRIKRNGAFVLLPMICLILSLAIIGELLRQTSIELKQLKKGQYHTQAIWLADAAAQRAAEKLNNQQNYSGETWNILPADIGGKYPGEVAIEIVPSTQNSKLITIRTRASYPSNTIERVRVIQEWPFKIKDTSTKK